MKMITLKQPEFIPTLHRRYRNFCEPRRRCTSIPILNSWSPNSQSRKNEEISVEVQKPFIPEHDDPAAPTQSVLQFNKQQRSDQECDDINKIEFGRFVTREAVIDEEYWTAAWLRAESHWEDRPDDRYTESYKRKFADQEFNSIKRRCKGQQFQKCSCIVAVKKKKKNVKQTVLKSVVGTLDLSIRHLLQGESFPGEQEKAPMFSKLRSTTQRYGYVANLCVAKSARRQGIASNLLEFAIFSAKSSGIAQLFVHVHKENKPAGELYKKTGFQMVEMSTTQMLAEENYLLCLKT